MQSIPRNPIVDTGPLFEFLLWRFSESFRIPTLLSGLRYLKTDTSKKSIQWYFTVAKPITTCPEVIAEVHRHAEGIFRGSRLGDFWRLAQKELTELGLGEKLVELVQMDGDILSSFGPTDTALIHIACLSPNLSQPVFTEDSRFAGQCRKKQVSVLGIADIQSIWEENVTK